MLILKMTNGITKIEESVFVQKDSKDGENLTLSVGDGVTTLHFNLHTVPKEEASTLGYGLNKISDIQGKDSYIIYDKKWEWESDELKELMKKLC